jgi:cyclic pyranopterin phosphate synthase
MARDALGRTIDYLRISVTERCNFRCVYCMPEEGLPPRSHDEMLSYDDIERLVRVATGFGIRHVRLTGGEPLARRNIEELVERLVALPGIDGVALTTNGALLPAKAAALKAAGLSRVNISLDTLDAEKFAQVTRRGKLEDTLAGIDAALAYGFDPVKVNCVAVKSLDQDFVAFAKLTLDRPLHVRFIEFMPIGDTGCGGTNWTSEDIIPSIQLMDLINHELEAEGLPALVNARDNSPVTWGPATSFRIPGAKGTVGFITPMSNHFCGACNRVRVTADGKLRPCLFSDREYDALATLRSGSDQDVARILQTAIRTKPADHVGITGTGRGMSQIGG